VRDDPTTTERTDGEPAVTLPAGPASVLLAGHDVPLGRYTTVRRLLPLRQRRMIGAWCFLDHFGPDDVAGRPGMQVPPHPHTGLQTVTWLVEGRIVHRDSLGNTVAVQPGQLNLMTSGHGISHAEQSPPDHPPVMHGAQLWVALPEAARHGAPGFTHLDRLPVDQGRWGELTVLVGELAGLSSPAEVHTRLVGAQLVLNGDETVRLPVRTDHEYGVLAMSGSATVGTTPLVPGSLLHLGAGHRELPVAGQPGTRLLLIGGEPFDEPLVMWWNFVGRSHEEIVAAREDWMAGRRFGTVTGTGAAPLPAPAMPTTRLRARDRHGRLHG
jgi:redox-sensitive bicupin YhaK (pirin superfamily)